MSQVFIGCSRGFNFSGYFTAGKWPDTGSGTPNFVVDHGAQVNAIAVDSAGNVYTGGVRTGNITTRKYNSSGVLQWSADHGADVYGIAVDSAGNVYTIGGYVSGYYVRKYDSSGALQYSINNGTYSYAIYVDIYDHVWTAGSRVNGYDASGSSIFFGNLHGGDLYAIYADASGNVYIGGALASGATTKKYNSSKVLQWSANHGATVRGLVLDGSGNVITTGLRTGNLTTRKYNNSGSLQWSADFGDASYAVATNAAGDIFVAGNDASYSGCVRKFNSAGSLQYYILPYGFVTVTAYGVAILESPSGIATPPGLALPLALAVPTIERSHVVPALALPLALGVPTVPAAPLPPVGTGQAIYRCYATGLPYLLELPLKSVQCRKRKNSSTWLSVSVLGTAALEAVLSTVLVVHGQIVVYSGLRNRQGVETMGELLRATLTAFDAERTPHLIPYKLTARVDVVLEPLQTRVLVGVQNRLEDHGRRSVRCAVNSRVRPGDTVDDGLRTFTADSLLYVIDANESYMEIEEAPHG